MSGASQSRSADRRYYGVVTGKVVDVNDPEQEGRVKLRFPWFDEATVTEWCRVRQLYAGPGYGTFFVPEVDDEVLVAFIHGDMRFPIVLGALYSGPAKPSTYRDADQDEKVIRTAAGHELLFDDRAGQERVHLVTPGGHKAELDDAGQKVTVSTSGGHEVVLDDAGSKVTVRTAGGQELILDAASGSATLKGASITLDAASVKLGGAGAAQSLVLGTAFMALFNAHVHTSSVPGTPTSPPVTPMLPALLSQVTKTV